MKYCFLPFMVLIFLGCGQQSPGEKHPSASYALSNTRWVSNFYYYHNSYFFKTDSTGDSQEGQLAWSCVEDTTIVSRDSIIVADERPFKYTLKDTVLTLNYRITDLDTSGEIRVFYLRKQKDKIAFLSADEYAYGGEILSKKP